MTTRAHVTRTFGPIHFEDLDPHRFEDLIRQLAYDFKQWQSIESTGRGGADDGFDIRAYEAVAPSVPSDDDNEDPTAPHPMEGNLWMIQCKREKELGPKKVEGIVVDTVDPESPPYGYILAAPVNFSKAAHDKFRAELRSRGVMEFYLWGAGELEDMLHQPKNDHILFAFFGISLVTRRRSRTTEVRSAVSCKNKLMRALGEDPKNKTILARDLQDLHYPYKDEYGDFDKSPRWKAYAAVEFHPLGLLVLVRRHFAFYDKPSAQWDFTEFVNNTRSDYGLHPQPHDPADEQRRHAVKAFWEQLPRANRAMHIYQGLIRFDSIALVDEKGDSDFSCPHVFIDFRGKGPFAGGIEYLEIDEHHHAPADRAKRVAIFPKDFIKPVFGTIHEDKAVVLGDRARRALEHNRNGATIYDPNGKYSYLKVTDVVGIDKAGGGGRSQYLLKVTNIRTVAGAALLAEGKDNPFHQLEIEAQIGKELNPADSIQVIEAEAIYDWQIGQNRPVIG